VSACLCTQNVTVCPFRVVGLINQGMGSGETWSAHADDQVVVCARVQNVTVCPFRVVDEINQGMDQVNERKVFSLLVEAACRPGTPQCFMFTPKLLPDLPYTPDVMPMLILNGAHMADLSSAFAGTVRALPSVALYPL
jgi:hypothetical protein